MAGPFGSVSDAFKTLRQNHALLKNVRGFQSRKEMDTRKQDTSKPVPLYKEADQTMIESIARENLEIQRQERLMLAIRVGAGISLFALLWYGIPPLIGLIEQWLTGF